jgi:hypothetical protein
MISRRMFGMGVALVAGDGLVRGIGAPAGQATPIGVQAGVSNGIVIARQVIIIGNTGTLLVYAPGPGLHNLVASISAEAGTDPYGNAYPGGIYGELTTNFIDFQYNGSIAASFAPVLLSSGVAMDLQGLPFNSEAGTLANPSLIFTDPGTAASAFGTDWGASGSGANGAVFQLQPNGWVNVAIDVKTTAAAPAAEVCAIPAGYAPSASIVCGALLPTAGGGAAYPLTAFSTGTLQQAGVPGVNGVRYAGIVTYPGPGITLP